MADLLWNTKTASGGWWDDEVNCWYLQNQPANQILNRIQNVGYNTDYNDVLLFYYSGHGDAGSVDEYAGALYCTNGTWLKLQTLAAALFAVPCGKVFVMIDSCGSGAAVLTNGIKAKQDAERFDQAVVNAFAAAEGNGGAASNAISFTNKFYVLTSSQYIESSYYHYDPMVSHFTWWLYKGAMPSSSKGKMPADANGDKAVTLAELYKYIKKNDKADPTTQHVQVYPKNSKEVIFKSWKA